MFLVKVGRERRIPFEITADPIYSAENIAELEKRARHAVSCNHSQMNGFLFFCSGTNASRVVVMGTCFLVFVICLESLLAKINLHAMIYYVGHGFRVFFICVIRL